MMLTGYNPIRVVHVKYVLRYVRELMCSCLTPLEDQIVMLHCGMYTGGQIVSFEKLSEVFNLASPPEAEEIYRQAVIKTRCAIPGSRLENWLIGYHAAYYPEREFRVLAKPDAPVPVWKTQNETTTPDDPANSDTLTSGNNMRK